jgi:peroxiredoxin
VQLRHYVGLQQELAINYCKLAVVSVDSIAVNDAFRTGLGATFPFLSDEERKVVKMLDMTETSKSRGVTAMPFTFSLMPDLTIHNLYCGYWYLGRPTLDELRMDLRAMLKKVRPDFSGPIG